MDIKDRCYQFSLKIFNLVRSIQIDPLFKFLIHQLLRSATSIGANVTEGKSSSSRRELTRYFQIALKSANETKYWLSLIRDSQNLPQENFKFILDEADQISRILGKSIVSLKSQ